MYPLPIQRLISAFSALPSVGQRTAERFVFYYLRSGKKEVKELIQALTYLMDSVKSCEMCWDFSDQSPCRICADQKRNHEIICVVDQPQSLQTIEKTGYTGIYHVLRGTVRPDDENSVRNLKIKELLTRAKQKNVHEIILALNPDLNGETTMMFLEKQLRDLNLNQNLTITRLARGLPMGSDLQYADEITLGTAIKNRIKS